MVSTLHGTAKYVRDLAERVVSTFVQAFLGALVAGNWFDISHIRDLSIVQTAGVAGLVPCSRSSRVSWPGSSAAQTRPARSRVSDQPVVSTLGHPLRADFGLQAGGGLAMWCVRVFTLSRFGHACLAVSDAADGWVQIVEAMPEGVRTRSSRVDEWTWSNVPLTDAQRDAGAAQGTNQVGKGYDWPGIAGFVVRRVWAKWRGGVKDHPDAHEFCSELVDWIYRDDMGVDLRPGFAPNAVSPGDLAEYLIEH